jgi:hypothetical protein
MTIKLITDVTMPNLTNGIITCEPFMDPPENRPFLISAMPALASQEFFLQINSI